MQYMTCHDPACGRPFQVNQFKTRLADSIERGRIVCPHCGLATAGESDSIFLTHALSAEEEARVMDKSRGPDNRGAD
jgi:hypothetical protein